MKLLVFLSLLTSAEICLADTVYSCSMGGYKYTGPVHSDAHNLASVEESESCLARQAMNSDKIGADYRVNTKKISDHIDKMLNNPECVDVKELLLTYKSNLQKHKEDLDLKTTKRIAVVEEKAKSLDMQKAFAYLGAFNATCSGGHNRKTSFINLDLINKIPASTIKSTTITENGQKSESCADVEAHGSDHLKSFVVSMKKAKGDKFTFIWDPYAVPDRVTVKSSNGGLLFDSGCKGTKSAEEIINLELPVPKGGSVIIDVINDCESPGEGGSSWDLRIRCAEEAELQCKEPKEELISLLKEEVNLTKLMLDASSLHRQCLMNIDHSILDELVSDGLITLEEGPLENGICDAMDEACQGKISTERNEDRLRKSAILPLRGPSSDQDQFRCPERPTPEESVLKRISYAYCLIGWRKLGVEKTILE